MTTSKTEPEMRSLYTDESGVQRLVDIIGTRPSGTTIRNERGEWPGIQFHVRWTEGNVSYSRWTVTFPNETPGG